MGRTALAAHRPGGRESRCGARVQPWNHLAHVGGNQARGEGRSVMKDFRRVVITGVGAVTPIGTAVDGLWSGLQARASAVRTLTRFDPSPFRSHMAAEIPD